MDVFNLQKTLQHLTLHPQLKWFKLLLPSTAFLEGVRPEFFLAENHILEDIRWSLYSIHYSQRTNYKGRWVQSRGQNCCLLDSPPSLPVSPLLFFPLPGQLWIYSPLHLYMSAAYCGYIIPATVSKIHLHFTLGYVWTFVFWRTINLKLLV